MHLLFRPSPPVPPSGHEWMSNSLSLPYGPFQPTHCAEHDSFECDPVLWDLWLEFHQNLRPAFSLPALDSPALHLVKHTADCIDRWASFNDFGCRLTDHLHLTGAIDVPRNIPSADQWIFVYDYLRSRWPSPALDGPMNESKLWVCMVYALTVFYINIAERRKELIERCTFPNCIRLLGRTVKNEVQALVSSLHTPISSHATLSDISPSTSTSSSSDSDDSLLSEFPTLVASGYQARPPTSVVLHRVTRS
ncbi:hypothetical protein C8R47DRAFT_1095247 [Mycena vitilis]|nr:hypothetical protein C8R47DRAFT_1095247 [Mycena vitilis]